MTGRVNINWKRMVFPSGVWVLFSSPLSHNTSATEFHPGIDHSALVSDLQYKGRRPASRSPSLCRP